jgi:hypothetical protein
MVRPNSCLPGSEHLKAGHRLIQIRTLGMKTGQSGEGNGGVSFGSLQLTPICIFAIRPELPHHVAMQGLHHAYPCEHRRAAEIGDEYERLDRSLPCSAIGLLELENNSAGIGAATRQRNGIIEFARLTAVANAATLSCRVQ